MLSTATAKARNGDARSSRSASGSSAGGSSSRAAASGEARAVLQQGRIGAQPGGAGLGLGLGSPGLGEAREQQQVVVGEVVDVGRTCPGGARGVHATILDRLPRLPRASAILLPLPMAPGAPLCAFPRSDRVRHPGPGARREPVTSSWRELWPFWGPRPSRRWAPPARRPSSRPATCSWAPPRSEAGARANGSFGSAVAAPAGYQPPHRVTGRSWASVSTRPSAPGTDPGCVTLGDFFTPGSPYEAWGIQIGEGTPGYNWNGATAIAGPSRRPARPGRAA